MTALIPRGLAAAVLAALPRQMGLSNGEIVLGTVFAVIFFTILLCAVFVFIIEKGRLNVFGDTFFRPFAAQPPSGTGADLPESTFDQSLGLPALREVFFEPNIVELTPGASLASDGGDIPEPPTEEKPSPPPPTSQEPTQD